MGVLGHLKTKENGNCNGRKILVRKPAVSEGVPGAGWEKGLMRKEQGSCQGGRGPICEEKDSQIDTSGGKGGELLGRRTSLLLNGKVRWGASHQRRKPVRKSVVIDNLIARQSRVRRWARFQNWVRVFLRGGGSNGDSRRKKMIAVLVPVGTTVEGERSVKKISAHMGKNLP